MQLQMVLGRQIAELCVSLDVLQFSSNPELGDKPSEVALCIYTYLMCFKKAFQTRFLHFYLFNVFESVSLRG